VLDIGSGGAQAMRAIGGSAEGRNAAIRSDETPHTAARRRAMEKLLAAL